MTLCKKETWLLMEKMDESCTRQISSTGTNRAFDVNKEENPTPTPPRGLGNNTMCFPATVALEKLALAPQSEGCREKGENEQVSGVGTPHSTSSYDDLEASSATYTTETDIAIEQEASISLTGFPLIEWASDICTDHALSSHPMKSLVSSTIKTENEAFSFLDRVLLGHKDLPGSPPEKRTCSQGLHHCPHAQTKSLSRHSSTDSHSMNARNRGRLVRSIAMGSRLAMLDSPIDIVRG